MHGSSVCVVDVVTGRAICAMPARSPRVPPHAAEGVDSIGSVASAVGIPIEDASEPAVSEATALDG
jgi:hypothetical protein